MTATATNLAPSEAGSDAATAVPAVVFTPRDDIRDAVRQELKALGVTQIGVPRGVDECIDLLMASRSALLVIDWEVGSEAVNQVLGATRGHFKIETRPIALLIPKLDSRLVATGAEYGISQIHAGPPSRHDLKLCLTALLREDRTTRLLRDTLVLVAEARAKGDWQLATSMLQELNAKLPGQERVIVELAENLVHENAWGPALALLGPLADLDPPSVRALHLMGRCYMQIGDFDRAIGLLGRAKVINPHNVERLVDLGHACLKSDLVDEAKGYFDEALALDEDNHDAKVGVGQCRLLSGELNEGLELLKAVSGHRELASVFNTAAILSIRQHRFELGLKLYRTGLSAIGRDDQLAARLVFNMGLAFKRWGRHDKAVACFERCLALDPAFGKAARQLHATNLSQPEAEDGAFHEEEVTRSGGAVPRLPASDPAEGLLDGLGGLDGEDE